MAWASGPPKQEASDDKNPAGAEIATCALRTTLRSGRRRYLSEGSTLKMRRWSSAATPTRKSMIAAIMAKSDG